MHKKDKNPVISSEKIFPIKGKKYVITTSEGITVVKRNDKVVYDSSESSLTYKEWLFKERAK